MSEKKDEIEKLSDEIYGYIKTVSTLILVAMFLQNGCDHYQDKKLEDRIKYLEMRLK